jgi:LPS export ABC transporter protein LptC/lipopolysaccharide transport protein LptA
VSRRHYLLQLVSGTILFFTIWFLWPRELDGFYRDMGQSVPDYAMTKLRYVSVKEGRVEIESTAETATFDMAERKMSSKKVQAFFYNAQNEKTRVTADRGIFYMDEHRIHLLDNVESESPDGFILRGPEAQYFSEKHFFLSAQPVEGETKDQSIHVWGNRAESSLDERKIRLTGDARTTYVEKKRGLTKVRGDRAEVDREKEKIRFEDNVRAEQDKIVATGNKADLFYAKKERGVRYMSIMDDVKILEPKGRYTRSQVAEFFAATDTIVLSGFPAVYNGDDAVTGDRITLYRTTGVVEVTATNAAAGQEKSSGKKAPPRPLTKEDEELIP